jgi:iron(III) transport system permease protein
MSVTRRLTPYLVFAAIAAFFGLFLIWPVVRVVVVGLGLPGSGARLQFTPSYLMAVFSSYEFRHSLFNSAAIAAVVTLLCTLISVPLALLTRRFDFRGKSVVTSLLLVPLVLPPASARPAFARRGFCCLLWLSSRWRCYPTSGSC